MEKEEVLVSVLVVSYNAENYILDLLESIRGQKYSKLELVIADDHSKDQTVEKVKHWLSDNRERFERVCLLASDFNRGTTKNLNYGLKECKGEFVKIIAADDILMPDCISDCLKACQENHWGILLGEAEWVLEDGITHTPHNENKEESSAFYNMSAKQQHEELLKSNNVICSPTAFYSREFMQRNHGFDEQYALIEDYPFWLKITANGEHINHFDKVVVKYRQSMTSATNPEKAVQIYNVRISKDSKKIFYRQRFIGLLKMGQIKILWQNVRKYLIRDLVILLGNNSGNKLCYGLTRFE